MTDTVAVNVDVLNISLTSLTPGAEPTVTPNPLEVVPGDTVQLTVAWPAKNPDGSDAPNTINGSLCFNGNTQDPFNDEPNGKTAFTVTRADENSAGTTEITIMVDAQEGTDTYNVELTINGLSYGVDPQVKVRR